MNIIDIEYNVHLHDHLNNFILGWVLSQNAEHIANVSTANLLAALYIRL